eukprot:s434_g6.t1
MLMTEQSCGVRRKGSMIPLRHCKGNFDVAIRLKAILIRRDVYKHLAGLFKKFETDILSYMETSWYSQFEGQQMEVEGAADAPDEDEEMKPEVSAYSSKGPLTRYIDARVEWLLWSQGTDGKLERLPLLREPSSPKILLYEAQSDGAIDYDEVKKRPLNVFTGVGIGASAERLQHVLEMWEILQQTSTPDMRDRSCLAVVCKVDNLKTTSALDVIKKKLPRKASSAVITLDPDQTDLLARIRAHVEDRLVLASNKGFTMAQSTMKFLKQTDTFFNRWPVPLVPVGAFKTCKLADYDLMFQGDTANDRLHEDCDLAGDFLNEDEVIPFPHEAHQLLAQEILHIFGANILVAVGVGSGLSILGGLVAGARVVAICSSKPHMKFVQKNLSQWLREKKLVPGTTLQKPQHLQQWEQKKGARGNAPPPPKASPPATNASPGPSTPAASPTSTGGTPGTPAANGGSAGAAANVNGGPGRNLLASFGNVAM